MEGFLLNQARSVEPIDDDKTPSMAVIWALESSGVDISGERWTLNDYIDPDALDRLFREPLSGDGDPTGMVTIEIADHYVKVTPDEAIVYEVSDGSPSVR